MGWRDANEDDRISEIETKIAGGLIEEVLQVAEGELKVVDEILESRRFVHAFSVSRVGIS